MSRPPLLRRAALVLPALAALASFAHAALAPGPDAVIARYVAATRGAVAPAAETTTYTRARVEGFGFQGRIETWSARPDRHYSRTELGPFKLAEGCDGVVSWRTDPTTGRVVRLTDRDSVDAIVATWFELERWADPDHGLGVITVAGHERDAAGTYTVLAVEPPGGSEHRPHRLWFSDATGLLAREESPRDQSMVATTLSDWRMSAGRMRPFVTVTGISTLPANQLRTVADSFAVGVDVSAVPFSLPDSSGGNALRWLAHEGVAVLPFEYRARHVWLRASIDGGPLEDFLFDTGASVTVLDSAFAASRGLRTQGYMQAAGAGAAGSASFTTLGSLAVKGADGDGVELRDLKVAVMSVNPTFARYFWRDMAGIVGYDFISRFVVTIDYDRGVLTLHDPGSYRHDHAGAPLPMTLNGIVPAVRATLDGRDDGLFRLDVGSSSTVDVHAPFARSRHLEGRLRGARPVSAAGFGGEFTTLLGRLRTMSIGPYAWKDPMVSVSRAKEGAFASEDFAGNIGNRVLERFRVTLDYEHRRVWLEPGRRYAARDAYTRTGLLLGWYRDHVLAESVLGGSPAAKAGVREGDRIVAVEGRPIAQWDLAALDALFDDGVDGRRVAITVSRDGRERACTMVLREMLR
jgi:hypothetical protein